MEYIVIAPAAPVLVILGPGKAAGITAASADPSIIAAGIWFQLAVTDS